MAHTAYRFSEFRLEPAIRELWRGDEEVSLPRKAFGCLAYLVEHRDRAVGRDELIGAIWGKENLADSVLGHAILDARRALDDNGEEQQFIKTVQGFGYRWVAPVEVETAEEPATATTPARLRPVRSWVAATAVVGVLLLALAVTLVRRGDETADDEGRAPYMGGGDITLLLPVTVGPGEDRSWIRFGIMELIADRLRDAGQPMVPSDTVIALMRGRGGDPPSAELERLTAATGARLVLAARVEKAGTLWRASVRSLYGALPPVSAFAEAADVLQAARVVADRMAVSLGLKPAPEPEGEPELALLLRQVEAAMLAQQMDLARELIASADGELRQHPEVLLRAARIESHSHRLDVAEASFRSLLVSSIAGRDPLFRARVLHGLGVVHTLRRDYAAAAAVLDEAARALGPDDKLGVLGPVESSLGLALLLQGRFDEAKVHLAQARRALTSIGAARSLAILDEYVALLEVLAGRYAEAVYYFDKAARAYAILNDRGNELRGLANLMEAHLALLAPQAAAALEPRLDELLSEIDHPELVAQASLAKAALRTAVGETRAAAELLSEVRTAVGDGEGVAPDRTWALLLQAEQLERDGDLEQAAAVAGEIIGSPTARGDMLLDDYLGRAWLIVLRARLGHGDRAAAAGVASEVRAWAEASPTRAAAIYAALASAEVAAAEGREDAAAAFERAWAVAEEGQAPSHLLRLAERYVPWLLRSGVDGAGSGRALVLVDRLARYADQHYGAAMLQVHLYHAVGPPSAWRAALARARALAGEREIPPDLRTLPRSTQTP